MEFIETVRCAIEFEGKILLLKKSKDSKFPDGYELPGGKSEQAVRLNVMDGWNLMKKEVKEETDINIPSNIPSSEPYRYMYSFTVDGIEYKRKVKCYYARLYKPQKVKLNNIPNEDHHADFIWVPIDDLSNFISENKISPNSLEFLKFIVDGYRQEFPKPKNNERS